MMTSVSWQLMDFFGDRARESKDNYEISNAWRNCESLVNNIHHGQHPSEWLPQFIAVTQSRLDKELNNETKLVWIDAIEFANIASTF
jgi:hypothetical protein